MQYCSYCCFFILCCDFSVLYALRRRCNGGGRKLERRMETIGNAAYNMEGITLWKIIKNAGPIYVSC